MGVKWFQIECRRKPISRFGSQVEIYVKKCVFEFQAIIKFKNLHDFSFLKQSFSVTRQKRRMQKSLQTKAPLS